MSFETDSRIVVDTWHGMRDVPSNWFKLKNKSHFSFKQEKTNERTFIDRNVFYHVPYPVFNIRLFLGAMAAVAGGVPPIAAAVAPIVPATYAGRVALPIADIVAPVGASTPAEKKAARERRRPTFADIQKLLAGGTVFRFKILTIASLLRMQINDTGDYAERKIKYEGSLSFWEAMLRAILAPYGLTEMVGTKAQPNFEFDLAPSELATTLQERLNCNIDFLVVIQGMTAALASDAVQDTLELAENAMNGLKALQRIRLRVFETGTEDQLAIVQYFTSPDNIMPNNTNPLGSLRKFAVLFSVHDSYGENEFNDRQKRDFVYQTLLKADRYHALTEWAQQNKTAFDLLSLSNLKARIVSTFGNDTSGRMSEKKICTSHITAFC
jgi:hypothetical protein